MNETENCPRKGFPFLQINPISEVQDYFKYKDDTHSGIFVDADLKSILPRVTRYLFQ